MESGFGCQRLTLLNVFRRARKDSCDHGEKWGGGLGGALVFLNVDLLARVMTDVLRSRLASESVEVLWRSRFLTRSRASSKAAADERLLLEADEAVCDADWIEGALLETERASRAL